MASFMEPNHHTLRSHIWTTYTLDITGHSYNIFQDDDFLNQPEEIQLSNRRLALHPSLTSDWAITKTPQVSKVSGKVKPSSLLFISNLPQQWRKTSSSQKVKTEKKKKTNTILLTDHCSLSFISKLLDFTCYKTEEKIKNRKYKISWTY